MSMIKQFRISEDDQGVRTAAYLEFDDKGTLTEHEEKKFKSKDDLREHYDKIKTDSNVKKTSKPPKESAGVTGDKPESIALDQVTDQSKDDVQKSNLALSAVDAKGVTRLIHLQEDMSHGGGPLKSGDPNVSDAARKRQDGAAEPRVDLFDLNQPAQPIAGARRGVAVLESIFGDPRVESEDEPIKGDGSDMKATPGELHAGERTDQGGSKAIINPKDDKASDTSEKSGPEQGELDEESEAEGEDSDEATDEDEEDPDEEDEESDDEESDPEEKKDQSGVSAKDRRVAKQAAEESKSPKSKVKSSVKLKSQAGKGSKSPKGMSSKKRG